MCNGSIMDKLISFSLPLMVSGILQLAFNAVDIIVVGRFSGSQALAAVGSTTALINVFTNLFIGISLGANVLAARFYAAGKDREMSETVHTSITLALISGIMMAVIGVLLAKWALEIMGTPDDVIGQSALYMRIYFMGMPFFMLYDFGASILRSIGDTRRPMYALIVSGVVNVILNLLFVVVFHMGVAGAALATLISRVFCAVVVLAQLRQDRQPIVVRDYLKIRPDFRMIRRILSIGIPSGVENSMFQLGKLAIQSSVSTLGTVAIAAQAMTSILENLNGIAAIGVGVGLMTIVGQCIGAGRKDEAVYYIKKLCMIAEVILIISCLSVFVLTKPITILGGMEKESADMCIHMTMWITIVKPLVWIMAFIPGYGMRAAGDVKFSMLTSCTTMWLCRFCLSVFMIRIVGVGAMGVWIGMFSDWTLRGIIFSWRFHSRKWLKHQVI